ncbi:hypothetical protein [Falsirhodobacter halotolerans]|uniref:hypothetical protein n=1 Tax=Falsirhodobacter halotolerans TaxID=1146892 RepID=UPI001FD0A068|nr:hypothetical protein [Falsirhodobacter halotolerans]MCJ8139516.1 hypothetical protein [Falsirhodobacter halotolerans]
MRLYQIHMAGAAARLTREREQSVTAAYLAAGLTRMKKMPRLSDLLKPPGAAVDVGLALGLMRQQLPKITLADWQKRGTTHVIQRHRQSAG